MFLRKNVDIDEGTYVVTKYNSTLTEPEQVGYINGYYCGSFLFKLKKDLVGTAEFLLEDTVVEYMPGAGKQIKYTFGRNDACYFTYLKTYVSIGIPTARYNSLFKQASEATKHNLVCKSRRKDDYHTWIMAKLPPDNINVNCYMYLGKSSENTCLGSLYEVVTSLKSNLLGYGRFGVDVLESSTSKDHFLCFTLNGFQATDLAKTASRTYPIVVKDPTLELNNALAALHFL